MSALDELRKLDGAVRRKVLPTDSADVIAARCRALLQLGDIVHLLRPAFEALETCGRCCGPDEHGISEVFAKLEEALR